MAVTSRCKRTVVSTKPVQPGKRHSLSVLDRLMGDESHLKIVYYLTTPREGHYAAGEITKMLRESLSETLTYFPIVTGRLMKEEDGGRGSSWMIKCNDAGVRMVEARAHGSLDEWLVHVDREKEMELVHWEQMFYKPYFWSTFYVQVTEFERGGVAIGLACSHLLVDPVCATMFIHAWADIASQGKLLSPPYFHALPTPKPIHTITTNNNLIDHYNNTTNVDHTTKSKDNITTFTTLSFSFTDSTVQSCIDMARTSTGPSSPSPFEALSGLFWLVLSRVKDKSDRMMDMAVCLDARKVLGLDRGFFGNCMVQNRVRSCSISLPNAAAAVGEAVEEIMDPSSVMGLIEWLKDSDGDHQRCLNGGDLELVCIGLESVEPYSVAFGDGFEPIRVSYYIEPIGGKWQVLILPANVVPGEERSGGEMGRVVMVTVPKEVVGALCGDELIQDLSPSVARGMKTNN